MEFEGNVDGKPSAPRFLKMNHLLDWTFEAVLFSGKLQWNRQWEFIFCRTNFNPFNPFSNPNDWNFQFVKPSNVYTKDLYYWSREIIHVHSHNLFKPFFRGFRPDLSGYPSPRDRFPGCLAGGTAELVAAMASGAATTSKITELGRWSGKGAGPVCRVFVIMTQPHIRLMVKGNPAFTNQLREVGSWNPIIYDGFYTSRWCRIFLPSTVGPGL